MALVLKLAALLLKKKISQNESERGFNHTRYFRLTGLARRSSCSRGARVMGRARKLHDIADLERQRRSARRCGRNILDLNGRQDKALKLVRAEAVTCAFLVNMHVKK